jgi:hypothetical protein
MTANSGFFNGVAAAIAESTGEACKQIVGAACLSLMGRNLPALVFLENVCRTPAS